MVVVVEAKFSVQLKPKLNKNRRNIADKDAQVKVNSSKLSR